jgi:hypothetical protein
MGFARNPVTGEFYSTLPSSKIIKIYGPDGKFKREIGENLFENFVNRMKFDVKGRLYVAVEFDGIRRLTGGKLDRKIEKSKGVEFEEPDFAPDAQGNVWVTATDGLYFVTERGEVKRIASAGSWKLGAVQAPTHPRLSPDGLLFVAENDLNENATPARISVFDAAGRIVRVFGRAGKARKEEGAHPGQTSGVAEIAFAPDGLIHVSQHAENGGVQMYKAF